MLAFVVRIPVFAENNAQDTAPTDPCHCEDCLLSGEEWINGRDVGSDSQVCPSHPNGPFQYSLGPDLPGRFDVVHKVSCLGANGTCMAFDYVPHSKQTVQYNATYHKIKCRKCPWYGLYNHSFLYVGGEIVCTVCGYVKTN